MSMRRVHVVVAIVAIVAIGLGSARVASADGLVIESYVGPRPPGADKTLKGLLEELARRDYLSSGAALQIESRVSKPALTEMGLPVDFGPQVEKGHKAWISGNFSESIQTLQPLVQKAHENPGAFAQNQQHLRDKLFKALVGIAVSQLKMGDPGGAKATFGELLRSFPDQQVSRSVYGPDVAASYEATKKELGALERGTLIVTLTGDTGPIYLNEKFENVGRVSRADLYPGEYRIFAAPAKGLTRMHRVTIAPGETSTLTIDTGFDLALQAHPEWVGLQFASAQERTDYEALYATKLAKALGKDSVIVVGIDQADGRPSLVGAIVDMVNQKDLRRASLALEPAPASMVGLAKFLTSGEEAAGLHIQVAGTGGRVNGTSAAGPVDRGGRSGSMWGGWKWIATLTAVGALGTGGYFLKIDGDCADAQCREFLDRKTPAYAALAGGAAIAGVAVVLWVVSSGGDDDDSEPRRAGFVVPTSGGAIAGYSLRF